MIITVEETTIILSEKVWKYLYYIYIFRPPPPLNPDTKFYIFLRAARHSIRPTSKYYALILKVFPTCSSPMLRDDAKKVHSISKITTEGEEGGGGKGKNL